MKDTNGTKIIQRQSYTLFFTTVAFTTHDGRHSAVIILLPTNPQLALNLQQEQ
jgi:hypothetical protein